MGRHGRAETAPSPVFIGACQPKPGCNCDGPKKSESRPATTPGETCRSSGLVSVTKTCVFGRAASTLLPTLFHSLAISWDVVPLDPGVAAAAMALPWNYVSVSAPGPIRFNRLWCRKIGQPSKGIRRVTAGQPTIRSISAGFRITIDAPWRAISSSRSN